MKLEIVEQYGAAYTRAFTNNDLKKYYIDAFSGSGLHISKETRELVDGSPIRALRITPPFDGYCFIDLDSKKSEYLEKTCGNRSGVHIHNGDANKFLGNTVLPKIQYKLFNRALCLLDPYGLHLEWDVIYKAGQSGAVDMFLNFPVMDMNRNAIWRIPDRAPREGMERLTKLWGDESWKDVAYEPSRQASLFGDPESVKAPNDVIAAAFRSRLKKVAGFKYVPEPLPMRNNNNAIVYYLFLASPKELAQKIITHIFEKYRNRKVAGDRA